MQELWLPIARYEGIYEISNYGRARSVDRMEKCKDGRSDRFRAGRFLKPCAHVAGYWNFGLCINGVSKTHSAHRLVATAFIPNDGFAKTVNHKDGNKANNVWTNLEWATYAQNNKHAVDQHLYERAKGESIHGSILKASDVIEIRKHRNVTHSELAIKYGVCRQAITDILSRRNWKHI